MSNVNNKTLNEENRTANIKRFGSQLDTEPYILSIDGEYEYVADLIRFGDIIESKLGYDASEFYFQQIFRLMQKAEGVQAKTEASTMQTEVKETIPKEVKPKREIKSNGTKQGQGVRGSSKRLF